MRTTIMLAILVLCLVLVGNASASLVAHYELATDFNDSSGNGLHGTPMGGASILSDPERGDVLSLGGAGQYVDCGNNALFNITEAITVAGWIKVNAFDVQWQSVVAKGNSAWRLSRDGTQNDLEFACTGLSGNWKVLGSINVNDGKWHHVAGVYDGSEISLYVDGILDVSLTASGNVATTTHQVWLGGNVERPGREWNGLLDDVRIYDHALSAAEIVGLSGKMGTGYTYQGRLLNGNKPADGSYDLEFKLYSDPGIGIQEGSTISINDLDVIDGYFTVELDFGSDIFSGEGLWLDISVRPGDSTGGFTTLSPRQKISPAPYALFALNGGGGGDNLGNHTATENIILNDNWLSGDGANEGVYVYSNGAVSIGTPDNNIYIDSYTDFITLGHGNAFGISNLMMFYHGRTEFRLGVNITENNPGDELDVNGEIRCDTLYADGNIGIGTTNPIRSLHIQNGQGAIRIDRDENGPSVYMVRTAPGDFSTVWKNFGIGTNADGQGSGSFFITDLGTATGGPGTERIHIDNEGNVGIGISSPSSKLHVLEGSFEPAFMAYNSFFGEGVYGRSDHGTGVFGKSTNSYGVHGLSDNSYAGYFEGPKNYFESNVGIGTLIPVEMLHIDKSSGSTGLRVSSDAASYQYMNFGATNGYSIGRSSDDKFFINRDEPLGTGALRVLTVQSNGNVGIGTKNPAHKLDVEGTVQAHAFDTGDIMFRKDGQILWRMFEDEKGLYVEKVKTGKVYNLVPEEAENGNNVNGTSHLVEAINELKAENESLKQRLEAIEKMIQQNQLAKAM